MTHDNTITCTVLGFIFKDIVHDVIIIVLILTCVTLDHKTSHKGQFFEIKIYISSESRINNLSIDVWFVMIGQYFG